MSPSLPHGREPDETCARGWYRAFAGRGADDRTRAGPEVLPRRGPRGYRRAARRIPYLLEPRMRGLTSFSLEAELAAPVTAWLAKAGYRVEAEVPILGRRADLVGMRDDALVAVELKMRDWEEALRQAIAYQLAADRVWVAMPLASASAAYRSRWRFEAEGIGLLAVDDRGDVRTPLPAAPSPRLLPYLRERIGATPAAWSWESPEIHRPTWPQFSPEDPGP